MTVSAMNSESKNPPAIDPEMNISALWDGPDCQWFVAWKNIGDSEMAGVSAGYGGGGAFTLERFYARHADGRLPALWIDFRGTDHYSGERVYFDSLPPEALTACDEAHDQIWEWNPSGRITTGAQ